MNGAVEQVSLTWDHLRIHGCGNPQSRNRTDIDAVERGGRDADHGHRVLVDEDFATYDVGCAAELRLPEIIREDDDRTSAGRGVIGLFDDAAESGADAEDREIAAGDDFGGNRFRIAAGREIDGGFGAAEDAVEEACLLLEVAADRVGHQVARPESAGRLIAFPIDENQALGFADGERVQDHLIDQRVDGGGGADAERQREQRGRGEAGATEERSGGEAEIVEEIAEPACEPDIADFLADLGEAEFDRDAAAGFDIGMPAAMRSATRRSK